MRSPPLLRSEPRTLVKYADEVAGRRKTAGTGHFGHVGSGAGKHVHGLLDAVIGQVFIWRAIHILAKYDAALAAAHGTRRREVGQCDSFRKMLMTEAGPGQRTHQITILGGGVRCRMI